jgi:tetratricopeptide (TPR) repeat protein
MGVVYRATDSAFGREVAVKVLLEKYAPTSGTARRFADEARITGQLQHPGIPPVHDRGTLPDGRPFLAMKLIKGDTLDDLLRARSDPAADRGRFVAVFEQVCQAVAYAHAHGVIHRDLKPQNVMVGSFGEVQVMDWGLAKVLAGRGADDPGGDPEATSARTEIRSARDDDQFTQAGALLGTPGFMPPEQAIGAVDQIDPRSDVFGLGAILCACLSGRPPYVGETAEATRQLAARGKLDDAFSRLDACGAEPELVALCKRCLGVERADRPRDAGELAYAVAALRQAADDRARRAEADRMKAEVRAAEHRKRRRMWIGLAATLLVGAVASSVLAVRARNAEHLAERRLGEEENARAEAEAVRDFFVEDMIGWVAPERKLGRPVTVDQVLDGAERAIGTRFKDQPLTEAAVRLTLGKVYRDLGLYEKAKGHLMKARALFTEHLGPGHRRTRETMNALGYTLWFMNQVDEATRVLEEALDRGRMEPGEEDIETLWSLHYLAYARRTEGRIEEAEEMSQRVLADWRRRFGEDHPGTILATNDHAVTLADLGDLEGATELFEGVYRASRRVRGEDHPDTLLFEANLAECLSTLGREDEGLRLAEQNLERALRVCGPNHTRTLQASCCVAVCLAYRRTPSAEGLVRALELSKPACQVIPPHPELSYVAWNVAGIAHYRRGELKEALATFEKVEAVSAGYYRCRNDFFLAMTYHQLHDQEKARLHFQRAVKWMREKQTRSPDLPRLRAEAADVLGNMDGPK